MRITSLSLLLACAACSAPPYPAYAIEEDAEAVAQVVVADGSLQSVVRAGRPFTERVGDQGWLRVFVPVRNIDDEEIQVLAQFEFYDAEHRTLPDTTNQQVLVLGPGMTCNCEALSRSAQANDFVLRLAWNK